MSDTTLVTGADGFIGSHLTEMLVREGHHVRALVLYNSLNSHGWLENVASDVRGQFEIVTGDIRDTNGVRRAVAGCDNVAHLAALIAIPHSYQSPSSYLDTNVAGTLNILEAARDLSVSRVIQTSTSEVYGTALVVPIREDHPLQGQSPYAASKIGADQFALSFHRSFGTPVVLLRPFNTYGPRQSARAVIPTVISQVLNGERRIKLGSVHPTRDFTFVTDTAQGFVSALTADDVVGEVINIGSGFEITVGDVVDLIGRLSGHELVVETSDERVRPPLSEVERLWADTSKAQSLLGWSPSYGGLEGFERGITESLAWFSAPENLALYKWDRYNT
jgi:NAD dependent epimerase/dehydratase